MATNRIDTIYNALGKEVKCTTQLHALYMLQAPKALGKAVHVVKGLDRHCRSVKNRGSSLQQMLRRHRESDVDALGPRPLYDQLWLGTAESDSLIRLPSMLSSEDRTRCSRPRMSANAED